MSNNFPAACVIGNPAQHSLSPLIHGFWLKQYGLQGCYARETVASSDLEQFIGSLREKGYVGANITVPHKEAVFKLVERCAPEAQNLGAVNTIWFEGDVLCGTNSDGFGFIKSLDAQTPKWRETSKIALVFGAGGAARGIIPALLSAGVEKIIISNRSVEKAEVLRAQFGDRIQVCAADNGLKAAFSEAGLIINTTSLGLKGNGSPAQYFELCKKHTVVSDIVYVPLETPFLAAAKAHGLATAQGLDMLLYQATIGFEKWFGIMPEVNDELRAYVLDASSRAF